MRKSSFPDPRSHRRRRWRIGAAVAGLALGCLWVEPAASAYKVQQGDTIEVSVLGLPELKQRSMVQMDGSIALPFVGALAVAGLEPAEVQRAVQKALNRRVYRQRGGDGREHLVVIQMEDVSAAIVEYRPVYIDGDVTKPGEIVYRPKMTVRQAMALAGGVDVLARRGEDIFMTIETLRGEHADVAVSYVRAAAQAARIESELNSRDRLGPLDLGGAEIDEGIVARIAARETDLLHARLADYKRAQDFIRNEIAQSAQRTSVIEKQAKEEEKGARADSDELQKVTELLSRGQTVGLRVTEARRALLLSSTRALQATATMLQFRKQEGEIADAMRRLDSERRIALAKELQDARSSMTTLRAKLASVESRLEYARRTRAQPDAGKESGSEIRVVRGGGDGQSLFQAVGGDFELAPGDVVEVMARRKSAISN